MEETIKCVYSEELAEEEELQKETTREAYWNALGYKVEGLEGMLERHKLEDLAYQGYPVPEDFIMPEERRLTKSLNERNLYRRMKDKERIEQQRTDPLAHPDETKRKEGRRLKGWPEREWETEKDYQPQIIVEV